MAWHNILTRILQRDNKAADDNKSPSSGDEGQRRWSRATVYGRLLLSPGYTPFDILLLVGGFIFATASGVPFPLLGILFGQLIDNINSTSCATSTGGDTSTLESVVRTKVLDVIYVTIANWCFLYLHSTCWSLFGERLVRRLRERYLRSLLRQELAFSESLPAGDVSSRLSTDLEAIQAGTSEKVGIVLGAVSYFAASYVVAFIKDAKLAGMLVSLVPAYFLMAGIGSYFIKRYSGRVSDSLASATSIASESLRKITLVHAFGAHERQVDAQFIKVHWTCHLLTRLQSGSQVRRILERSSKARDQEGVYGGDAAWSTVLHCLRHQCSCLLARKQTHRSLH
jgi:ABC-type multidrug transport system fused ATPase/permease subunit